MLVKLTEISSGRPRLPFLLNLDRVVQAAPDRVYLPGVDGPTPATRLDLLPAEPGLAGGSVWVLETLDQILVAQDHPGGVLTNPDYNP